MKRITTLAAAAVLTMSLGAQAVTSMFKPYKSTQLRLPAVPLLVNDPYFSIWSPYDRLTDGTARHWTGREMPIEAFLRVDGALYRLMQPSEHDKSNIVLPMGNPMSGWQCRISRTAPAAGWEQPAFDDSKWNEETGPFGNQGLYHARSLWSDVNSSIYVRRHFTLTPADVKNGITLQYDHDDVTEVYINGTKILDTGNTWANDCTLKIEGDLLKLLREGDNVIAVHCHNTTGNAYLDFGLLRKPASYPGEQLAKQKSVDVMPTSSYYTLQCGPVELDLVFTAPMIMDDLDLLSTPVNYISYQVRSTDGKPHSAQLLLTASPLIAANSAWQPTQSSIETHNGVKYAKTGTIDQPILAKKGDHICIDWGYLYMPAINGNVAIDAPAAVMDSFTASGTLPQGVQSVRTYAADANPVLAYAHDFGTATQATSFAMIGYDEVNDIEYMYKRYKAYWAHGGKVSIFDAFSRLASDYQGIMSRCRQVDKRIYDDGFKAGGKKYAELLSSVYRHVLAAHKLFVDENGNLLYFSKENDSNGCVNTVDLTYPSSPLFLLYNPDLLKGMMTSIFEYSRSGRWTKPFAAHDLGTYPIANGQAYPGDGMPLEEAGNMVILAAAISQIEGNASYASRYWDILTTWTNYLVDNGQDPANQLCTDDFAGHWAHNCNLSAKAIMGITGYSIMARLKGDAATSKKYMEIAKQMAAKWDNDAREGDHYRLAFDRPNTWGQKYNMVWDRVWQTHVFPAGALDREVSYYLTKQNKYGLPLDCRADYTKNDWILWSAAMASNNKDFLKLMNPVWDFSNETTSRVATSDWYDSKTGVFIHFIGRSVVGGWWMKALIDKLHGNASK